MPESILERFRDSLSRFRAKYNKETGTWRLYDLWDNDLQKFSNIDEEVPDSSSAVTVIPELGFLELVHEAERLGIFEMSESKANNEKYAEELSQLRLEKKHLEDTIEEEKKKDSRKYSESFLLKKLVVENILKLVAVDEVGRANY